MSQHDYVIENQTFPATRTDINNALAAVASTNAGSSAPSTTYAHQLWYDTTANKLKQRNADNDAWIDLFDVDQINDTASAAGSVVAAGSNLIINSAMTVSQRGNSTGVTSTGYYGPDRYQLTLSNLGTWSISQSSTAPSGFGNSYKLEATTADASPAASDYAIVVQKFEGQNLQQLKKGTASAESVTLSFWVRSSKTGTYIAELFDNDNSRSISAAYTISSADTFEYKTITFAGDTTGAFDDDNASSLEVVWWLAAGTDFTSGTLNTSWGTRTNANIAVGQVNMADTANATWYITGVKLEVGETATPFEHESFDTTYTKCLRYYETSYATGTAVGTSGGFTSMPSRAAASINDTVQEWTFKARKRGAFTVTAYGQGGTSGQAYVQSLSADVAVGVENGANGDHFRIYRNGGSNWTANTFVSANWECSSEL